MTTKIYSPPGYGEIVPLDRKAHRFAYPGDISASFLRGMNAIPLTLPEFGKAQCHYPIIFVASADGEFSAVAITSLRKDENLFVGKDGRWRSGVYMPAYVRAYPLCIAEVLNEEDQIESNRLVCIAKQAIVSDGIELFDEAGQPTELWNEKERFLQEYENARTLTQDMCRLLKAHNVLVPFAVQAEMGNHEKHVLTQMYRVDEALLGKLTSYQMRQLIKRGWMQSVYAHILSLGHFQDLLGDLSLH